MWPLDDVRTQARAYGDYTKIGEVIGVLLEFNEAGIGNLTFYRNGVTLGKAFDNLSAGMYYPCVSLLNN